MQTWESLFGLESLSKLDSLSFQNDIVQDSKENSVLLSLRTGLSSALKHVAEQRAMGKTVYPPDADIFNAFKLTSPHNLKVVIIGQDPYHGENQAHGLCFSVLKGNKIPPSLRNIYKELSTDIPNFESPEHGDLSHWAEQGVLLLNTVLSVEHAQAHSHKKVGWELSLIHI